MAARSAADPGARHSAAALTVDLESVYREHSVPLLRFLTRFTGDSDIAADAVQEAFIRMVERPPRTDRVRTWLFEVAMNVARGSGRTRSRRLRLLNGEPPATFVSAAPVDAHTQLEVTERRQIVRAALEKLAERDRTILLMKAEGFSLQEIAQVIGTSPGSVGTLAARALERLARELRLDDEGEWR